MSRKPINNRSPKGRPWQERLDPWFARVATLAAAAAAVITYIVSTPPAVLPPAALGSPVAWKLQVAGIAFAIVLAALKGLSDGIVHGRWPSIPWSPR